MHPLLVISTYRCHSKSPPTVSLYGYHRYSEPQKPYPRSWRHRQLLQRLLAFHLAHAPLKPYQEQQRYWLKNAPYQKCHIRFQRDAESLKCHRNDARCPSCHDAQSKSYAGNFDDPHPKLGDRMESERHNAKRLSALLFPN